MIVDECHRAVGKNDAVSAISKMHQDHYKFRVIGLSATPGSRREAVQVLHLASTPYLKPLHEACDQLQCAENAASQWS